MHMKFFIAAVFLVLLILLVGCQTETGIAREISDKDPEYEVSAFQLVADYEASESVADRMYKGKVILVSGVFRLWTSIPNGSRPFNPTSRP